MRVAVWSPLPPAPSGIADHVAEALPFLARGADVTAVVEDPEAVDPGLRRDVRVVAAGAAPEVDIDLYQVGNSPAHTYVYRAALGRPGVVVLHEWSLHDLVLRDAVERGEPAAYAREMRRAHGEVGSFVARQVARGLGGDLLPALFPLNDRLLEGSLGIVAPTDYIRARAAARRPGLPVLHLPLHFSIPFAQAPSREEARRRLGLSAEDQILTAPGLATPAKGLDLALRVAARLHPRYRSLRLVVAGDVDPQLPLRGWARESGLGDALVVTGRTTLSDFVLHLVAADVVLGLRFPTHGEMSAALVRALGLGRAALVTAGTPAAEDFPPGVVVPVDPGPREAAEMEALLGLLLERPALREAIGGLARDHVRRHHDLAEGTGRLLSFLAQVRPGREALQRKLVAERAQEGTRLGYLLEEVRGGARELGLAHLPPGLEPLLSRLAGS